MPEPERIAINVAVSVLADISLGIYRTPANALKELVSNAFDADATRVVISTGFPHFHTMTCRDNGNGMSVLEFKEIMSRIGGSAKREGGTRQFTDKGRPIIGKIGIGILAVAQICRRFTIISSQSNSDTKFEAVIDFEGLATEEAKTIPLGSEEARRIGSYVLVEDLPEDRDAHYTRIILEEVGPGFKDRLLGVPEMKIREFRLRKGDPKTLSEFVEWLTQTSVCEISAYNRLLWELGVICPVPYLEDGPIKGHDVLAEVKRTLHDYGFTVKIDGLELRKPILFPTSPEIRSRGEDYEIYPIEFDDIVEGKRLAFNGYIYHQRLSIMPPELRGLLVRMRNVAIGMYDKSLLNYPKAQGPRMAGLSGEIYVEAGLEDALNVDRNSFRETDPHYLKLQEVVYTRLGGDKESKIPGIFSDISKRSRGWNAARREAEAMQERDSFLARIEALSGKSFEIESCQDESVVPVEVDIDRGRIVIYEQHPIFPRARAARGFLEKILIAYEIANKTAESKDAVHKEFYQFLTEH